MPLKQKRNLKNLGSYIGIKKRKKSSKNEDKENVSLADHFLPPKRADRDAPIPDRPI